MKFRNSKFEIRICRNAAGFTLIEVVLIIVIVSVFMAAIGIPLLSSLRESDLPEISTIAYFLGLEKLEELAPETTGSISDEARAAVSGYAEYEREVAVADVGTVTISPPRIQAPAAARSRSPSITAEYPMGLAW
jgi:Tfp pilus assembly protein PilV